ncbi:sigma-70 family RNA polymerase sigma factor [Afifella pfennigii]|uniref:sigma-70 family RNA polymerase sigma factor n=1 Tax=Afifella pfennigii TaxID=209897 RepID=UPI0005576C79|nr:sigma-70 family RNA polymerase sigma factor [Afifella pfennigii]
MLTTLLERAGRRDRVAFEALYRTVAGKLFAVQLRILDDRSLAEETLQEAFLKIWERASSYERSAGAPLAWMIAIARNTAIDRLRSKEERLGKKSITETKTGEDILQFLADGARGADPLEAKALRHCLDGLETQARETVVLAYCYGFSREELAQRYARPIGTIKTWLHRSLKTLFQCLEGG